jgi:DNA polymerase-3 subunit alpha
MHAAGIVISNEELWKKAPLWKQSNAEDGHYVTQYTKDYLEDVDLIKFDFLGLKTLTVIDNAIKLVKARFNKDILWERIDFNDPKTYETIQSGNTLGIFQIESSGMQKLAAKLKPDCFEDVIAMIALYRPGPLNSGMVDDFIDIKHGKKSVEYAFEALRPILEPTYGVIVYQEQVMQVVQTVGGFSLGGADLVRRAMSKKKEDEMLRLKTEYLEGAAKNGFDTTKADALFELIMKFAEYGFNKSHSAAYALITFQTAYLKTYYPAEFMAALLTSEENNTDKITKYIEEIRRLDIELLPPSVSKSKSEFSVISKDGKDAIIYGLGAIKGVGGSAIDEIIDMRQDRMNTLEDLVSNSDCTVINKRVYESLIKSGALDEFGYSRKTLMQNVEYLTEQSKKSSTIKKDAKFSLFGDDDSMSQIKLSLNIAQGEFSQRELLGFEQEYLGVYISGHPLDEFKSSMSKIAHTNSSEFDNIEDGSEIIVIGKVEDISVKLTKSGNKMGIITILDMYGSMEATVFAQMQKLESMPKEELEKPLVFKMVLNKDDQQIRLKVGEIYTIEEAQNTKITLKSNKITAEELEENKEYFDAIRHSTILDVLKSAKNGEHLIIAKINNISIKDTKSGNKMAVISVADKSSNADMFAFDVACSQASQISDTSKLYALKITPPRDANSKIIINQIIDIDEAKNGDITLRNAPRKRSQQDSAQTTKPVVSIVGKIEIDLELSQLNKNKINEIYQLAYRHNAKIGEKKSLLLRVIDENKNQVMVFTTEFSVSDEFKNEVKMLLVG